MLPAAPLVFLPRRRCSSSDGGERGRGGGGGGSRWMPHLEDLGEAGPEDLRGKEPAELREGGAAVAAVAPLHDVAPHHASHACVHHLRGRGGRA